MRIGWNNVGVLLAIFAGLTALGWVLWPIGVPQARSMLWFLGSVVGGIAFLFAAYIAERHARLARGILFIGGLALILSAVYFGQLFRGESASLAVAIDLLPGLLALAAAATIGPFQRRAVP